MGPGHASQLVAVGVDGTAATIEAARYAVELAGEREWDLMVVHSYQAVGTDAPASTTDAVRRDAAESVVDEVLARLEVGARTRVHRIVTPASAVDTLCQISGYVSLLVLGQHEFDLTDLLLTGQVGPAVAAEARCPVVVVPPGWSRARSAGRPVVVALDGETPAEVALRCAFEEAELHGTRVLALLASLEHSEEALLAERQAKLDAVLAELEQDHPKVGVSTLLVHGDPRASIPADQLAAAQVVVGRLRANGAGGWWSRRVAGAVMTESACPVVITPTEDPAAEARARGAANAYIDRGGPRGRLPDEDGEPSPTGSEATPSSTPSAPAPERSDGSGEQGTGAESEPESVLQPVGRSRAWAGVVAPVLFVVTVLVDGLQPGHDPGAMLVSGLSLGELGWIQRTCFLLAGGLVLVFASALSRAFREGPGARLAPVVLVLLGVGLVLSGLVDGRPSAAMDRATTPGVVHQLLSSLVFVGLPVVCFLLAWRLRRQRPTPALAQGSAVVGGALVLLIVLFEVSEVLRALSPWSGLVERALLVVFMGWLFAVAVVLLRRPGTAGPATGHEQREPTRRPATLSLPALKRW